MSTNDTINQEEIMELKKELNKHKKEYKLYQRIMAVLMVKSGETRKKNCGIHWCSQKHYWDMGKKL